MNLQFWIGVLISLPLHIMLHELGHYIPAKMFGWNPTWYFLKYGHIVGIDFVANKEGNAYKLHFISFCGIIGVIPWLMLIGVTRYNYEFALLLCVIAILVAYSLYETIHR